MREDLAIVGKESLISPNDSTTHCADCVVIEQSYKLAFTISKSIVFE